MPAGDPGGNDLPRGRLARNRLAGGYLTGGCLTEGKVPRTARAHWCPWSGFFFTCRHPFTPPEECPVLVSGAGWAGWVVSGSSATT